MAGITGGELFRFPVIWEGTNEIQRLVIARALLGG